jgi:hypothetical protein
MTSNVKYGDEFWRIPKLDASGKDWPLWKGRLELSLLARGLLGHLTDAGKPIDPAEGKSAGWSPTTAAEIAATATYEADIIKWNNNNIIVRQQIAVLIPDSLFIQVLSLTTAKEYFNVLKGQFGTRSLAVTVELRRQLGELKLKEGGDARAHIDALRKLREELASAGDPVSDKDFFNITFASLPRSYNNILSAVSTSMQLHQKTPTAHELMNLVINEYDRMLLQNGGKLKSKGEDAAFSTDGNSQKGKQRNDEPKFPWDCNNCGWKGHKKADCWEEGGGKAGKAPRGWKSHGKKPKDEKSKASGSSADASKSKDEAEPDGVWLACTEALESWEAEDTPVTTVDSAKLAWSNTATHGATVELYDSGASQHMSPFRDHFINFKSIPPHPILAADKRTFDAIGRGDLPIEIPNGRTKTRILLTNVLYAPSMGVTLVSIRRLTIAGYAALFHGDTC